MNTNPQGQGWKTTEFKLSVGGILLNAVLTYLATRGYIKITDIDPIINSLLQLVMGISGIISIYGIIHSYIQSRTTIKTAILTKS